MSLTLGYWDIRGLAEPIRLLMEYCGLEYKQNKVENTQNGLDGWMVQKQDLQNMNPFANLPYLMDDRDGQTRLICESVAIMHHIIQVSNRTDLLGVSDEQKVWCETFMGITSDFNTSLVRISYNQDYSNLLPDSIKYVKSKLSLINQHLQSNKDYTFFTGQSITIADLKCFENIRHALHHDQNVLDGLDRVQQVVNHIQNQERIQQYLNSDRFQKHPFNNPLRATKP